MLREDSSNLRFDCASRPCKQSGSRLKNGELTRYEQDFEETKLIAKGSFGIVTKCKKRVDGCFYAVKRTLKRFRGGTAKIQALKEVFALAALPAIPNIVRYFSAWVEDGFAYIQMELCDASLKQLVEDPEVIWDEKKYRTVLKQVATGIKHLHDKNLCHMDIKPENIFVKDGVFKIGDMGLVTVIKGAPREVWVVGRVVVREMIEDSVAGLLSLIH